MSLLTLASSILLTIIAPLALARGVLELTFWAFSMQPVDPRHAAPAKPAERIPD